MRAVFGLLLILGGFVLIGGEFLGKIQFPLGSTQTTSQTGGTTN